MKLYELIILVNSSLSTEDSNTLIDKVEALFPGAIREKDDIGYQTVYNVEGIKKGGKGYFVSYVIEVDSQTLPEIKQKMSLLKWVLRAIFLLRGRNEPFHAFRELNDLYTERVNEIAAKDKKGGKTHKKEAKVVSTEEVEIVLEGEETNEESGTEEA